MSVDPRFFRIVDGIKTVDLATRIGASISGGDSRPYYHWGGPTGHGWKGRIDISERWAASSLCA